MSRYQLNSWTKEKILKTKRCFADFYENINVRSILRGYLSLITQNFSYWFYKAINISCTYSYNDFFGQDFEQF